MPRGSSVSQLAEDRVLVDAGDFLETVLDDLVVFGFSLFEVDRVVEYLNPEVEGFGQGFSENSQKLTFTIGTVP